MNIPSGSYVRVGVHGKPIIWQTQQGSYTTKQLAAITGVRDEVIISRYTRLKSEDISEIIFGRGRRKRKVKKHQCPVCGQVMITDTTKSHGKAAKTCSRECGIVYRNNHSEGNDEWLSLGTKSRSKNIKSIRVGTFEKSRLGRLI